MKTTPVSLTSTPDAQPQATSVPVTATPEPTVVPKTPADYLAELQTRDPLEPVMVPEQYIQKFRPHFHFSPIKGWIGDPDGTIHYKGKYHLFWWGHAESTDLVHWQQRPFPGVNLPGLDSGSGSVIVDEKNASGFAIPGQNPPMLAFFTIFDAGDGHQAPGLAVSYDYTNFAYYDQNPLIVHEEKDFRDPHVFYYKPTDSYVIAIAIPNKRKIGFYGSKDLKKWEHLSDFGLVGAISQVWECPDLFQLPVDGDPKNEKWVMLVGMGPNTEQYFIGDFDGKEFTLDPKTNEFPNSDKPEVSGCERTNWLDYGPDYYAARTFNDYDNPSAPKVVMGWLGNWEYATVVPTSWGKGAQALPREISLKSYPTGLRIIQKPVPGLETLRQKPVQIENKVIQGASPLSEFKPVRNSYEIDLTVVITDPNSRSGIRVAMNESYGVSVGYDAKTSTLFLDRQNTENASFSGRFWKYLSAPLAPQDCKVRLHLYVDQSSIEVFANGGEITMSALMFPNPESLGIELFSENGSTNLSSLKAWELDSIWGVPAPLSHPDGQESQRCVTMDRLEIKNLKTFFFLDEGIVKVVDGVDLRVADQDTIGIIGESGCGKSVMSQSIMRLVQPPGEVVKGAAILELKDGKRRMGICGSNSICFRPPSLLPFTGSGPLKDWFAAYRAHSTYFKATSAMARRMVEGLWWVMTRQETYKPWEQKRMLTQSSTVQVGQKTVDSQTGEVLDEIPDDDLAV